jgi:glycosyltransferase involved in cell wall biosynthesis
MKRTRIVHLTSVHSPNDVRIFHKECKSLSALGYDVTLVAPGATSSTIDGVRLIGAPLPTNRRDRVFNTTRHLYRIGLGLQADLYHFHDPELMPIGVLLKIRGKKVIYDIHEEVANDILDKDWIAPMLRPVVSRSVGLFERICSSFYDGIVITRPSLYKSFDRRKTVLVHNYPIIGELCPASDAPYSARGPIAAYVGGGTPERGIREMVIALGLLPESVDLTLHFAGTITPAAYLDELKTLAGWQRVRYLGWQNRTQVAQLLSSARLGIVTFLPIANHMNSEPTKLFEYMSAKLPVVASNIPHWESLVRQNGYGVLADPTQPSAIATAILEILRDPAEAEAMGQRGHRAVMSEYNWGAASANLAQLYQRILQ